jgi:hypothetical protein
LSGVDFLAAIASGITANVVTFLALSERSRGIRVTIERAQHFSLGEKAELREQPDGRFIVRGRRFVRTREDRSIFRVEKRRGLLSRGSVAIVVALAVALAVGFLLSMDW